ncbi:hypothetical protein [Aestuariibaculum marinum]|uniref:Uncharacterized protein n=1 Tax=Aestuariibaculum marinum TaxID=2683592 RepID=A0A8J6UB92_9FLAO|nr:hypothetical protein [Aestuariibaculum marinum]MBD0825506.1 hypothetical protein [Aestuariibaculum marinum]
MRRVFKVIIIFVSFLAIGLLANRYYYDFKECWTLRNKIIWTKSKELVWSDFVYDENLDLTDNIDANIGISARYRINNKIHYRSNTVFVPSKSFVSDTTNPLALRIANTRFDLCEVYRRKLETRIDSLRTVGSENIDLEDLAKQDVIFVEKFSEEWTKFLNVPQKEMLAELEILETRIKKELSN